MAQANKEYAIAFEAVLNNPQAMSKRMVQDLQKALGGEVLKIKPELAGKPGQIKTALRDMFRSAICLWTLMEELLG